ncbi:MAG: SRPBCC family protein [Chloroflexales bacterium]|nr:SRPBCC family protein [Chloroflexales bacterium]
MTIQAPPEVVWNMVQDVARRLEWDVRTASAELLTPSPIGKGTRMRVTYNMWGFPLEVEMELVAWSPPLRSGVKGKVRNSADTVGASWNFIQNSDGSTTWTTRPVFTARGPLGWFREQLFGRTTAYLTAVSQRKVKRLIEAEYRYQPEPLV